MMLDQETIREATRLTHAGQLAEATAEIDRRARCELNQTSRRGLHYPAHPDRGAAVPIHGRAIRDDRAGGGDHGRAAAARIRQGDRINDDRAAGVRNQASAGGGYICVCGDRGVGGGLDSCSTTIGRHRAIGRHVCAVQRADRDVETGAHRIIGYAGSAVLKDAAVDGISCTLSAGRLRCGDDNHARQNNGKHPCSQRVPTRRLTGK